MPGRVRVKLAKMIVAAMAEKGIEVRVKPEDLWPTTGHYRTSRFSCADPWQGKCERNIRGHWLTVMLGAGSTMTEIVKAGVDWTEDGIGFEIYATDNTDYHVVPAELD